MTQEISLQLAALIVAAGLFSTACSKDCDEGGRSYDDGANWTCSDGCNYCSCNEGSVTSTLIGCPSPPGPAAGKLSCQYNSRSYRHGESWDCAGGSCQTCTCEDGDVKQQACAR